MKWRGACRWAWPKKGMRRSMVGEGYTKGKDMEGHGGGRMHMKEPGMGARRNRLVGRGYYKRNQDFFGGLCRNGQDGERG